MPGAGFLEGFERILGPALAQRGQQQAQKSAAEEVQIYKEVRKKVAQLSQSPEGRKILSAHPEFIDAGLAATGHAGGLLSQILGRGNKTPKFDADVANRLLTTPDPIQEKLRAEAFGEEGDGGTGVPSTGPAPTGPMVQRPGGGRGDMVHADSEAAAPWRPTRPNEVAPVGVTTPLSAPTAPITSSSEADPYATTGPAPNVGQFDKRGAPKPPMLPVNAEAAPGLEAARGGRGLPSAPILLKAGEARAMIPKERRLNISYIGGQFRATKPARTEAGRKTDEIAQIANKMTQGQSFEQASEGHNPDAVTEMGKHQADIYFNELVPIYGARGAAQKVGATGYAAYLKPSLQRLAYGSEQAFAEATAREQAQTNALPAQEAIRRESRIAAAGPIAEAQQRARAKWAPNEWQQAAGILSIDPESAQPEDLAAINGFLIGKKGQIAGAQETERRAVTPTDASLAVAEAGPGAAPADVAVAKEQIVSKRAGASAKAQATERAGVAATAAPLSQIELSNFFKPDGSRFAAGDTHADARAAGAVVLDTEDKHSFRAATKAIRLLSDYEKVADKVLPSESPIANAKSYYKAALTGERDVLDSFVGRITPIIRILGDNRIANADVERGLKLIVAGKAYGRMSQRKEAVQLLRKGLTESLTDLGFDPAQLKGLQAEEPQAGAPLKAGDDLGDGWTVKSVE